MRRTSFRTSSYIEQDQSLRQKEKLRTTIFENSALANKWVAQQIAEMIREKQSQGKNCILGLATGSTPKGVYMELIRMHKEEGLSFKNVISFNLDEYYPISKTSLQSYNSYMRNHLFSHVDIPEENINIPDGTLEKGQVEAFCKEYEKKIARLGGVDIQILGIGRTGHIGFNEPGSSIRSQTRLITLDKLTRTDAASDFMGIHKVPKYAITMGIQTILGAKRIIIMAYSESKAGIVQKAIEGDVTADIPSTYLQHHSKCDFVLDKPAAALLTRYQAPWTIHAINNDPNMEYDEFWAQKAVYWLSLKLKKPILRLVEEDYEDNGLMELVKQFGDNEVGKLNLRVFQMIQNKITAWPCGGKPEGVFDDYYFDHKTTQPKNVLIFSPHPDDDVICMGATMEKLIKQGHNVYVAYQTSGNIAVQDYDAQKNNDFVKEFMKTFFPENKEVMDKCDSILQQLLSKEEGQQDSLDIRNVKTLVRRTEARIAANWTGVKIENTFALDLPFYESGEIVKKPLQEEDLTIIENIIHKIKPDFIYAAGDLTDPHGTHRVCLQAIMKVLERLDQKDKFLSRCEVYLYRGAWQEWELELVDYAVPMSPQEAVTKRHAIFKHASQKDGARFPGADRREFWQRAEDRNKATAQLFTNLGFTNYEAMECFVKLSTLKGHVL